MNNREQRFGEFCATVDRVVEDTGGEPSKLTGYAISKAAFGKKPNGEFYAFYEEWLKLRRAVPGAPLIGMPAEAEAELESWTDHLKTQIMERMIVIVRGIAGSFEQTTAMRVVALERLCTDQSRRSQAVIATLVETEAELGETQTRLAACGDELKQEREYVQRLLGRLEERDTLLKALAPRGVSGATAKLPIEQDVSPPVEGHTEADRSHGNAAGKIVAAGEPVASAVKLIQPLAIETDPLVDSQIEMPLATSASADAADDDDRG